MTAPVHKLLTQRLKRTRHTRAERVQCLQRHAEPLPALDDPAFGALFDRYADARVVLIGEASHGSSEFYRTRAAITRRLIEEHGFSIVAVEADWPDAAQIDRMVRSRPRGDSGVRAFARFPTWMWRNAEVMEFVSWLQQHNGKLPAEARVEFRGLDVYSLRGSISQVLAYLDATDPEQAREARRRYGCLTPWQDEPVVYGHRVERAGQPSCEEAVLEQLRSLLDERLERFATDHEALFDAAQNARVVRSAEQYYRLMYRGSTESWNLRDRHMFDTLQALLNRRGPEARAVVWAHNSHIGNAAGTAMGWRGEFNIGELSRIAWGRQAVLIGMGTDRGSVAAAEDWDAEMQVMEVRPSLDDSWEHHFLEAGIAASLTDWRDPVCSELREALSEPLLERAIGVIYRPRTERWSHYFEAVLADQFDAWIWLEQTRAVQPLPAPAATGHEDDTFPFGL